MHKRRWVSAVRAFAHRKTGEALLEWPTVQSVASAGGLPDDDDVEREKIARRAWWERAGFRLVQFVFSMIAVVTGLRLLADGQVVGGVIVLVLGAAGLAELVRGAPGPTAFEVRLSAEQRAAVRATTAQEGRSAAVAKVRDWTGATTDEAAAAVSIALAEDVATRNGNSG